MTSLAVAVFVLVLSYLFGAIPFGYLVARWRGVNIFEHGSGNIGATNVARILGQRFGVLVFLLDFAKGALPVAAASLVGEPADIGLPPDWLRVLAGLSAFLGHLFSIYLRFRGGKGVATAAGVVAVLLPVPMLLALLVWTAVVASLRVVALGSLTAAAFLCLSQLCRSDPFGWDHVVLTCFCLLVTVLVFIRHHANIARLLQGKENQMRDNTSWDFITRLIHVLALGLWFGMSVFFNLVVGVSLFETFWQIGEAESRPIWFPSSRPFQGNPEAWKQVSSSVPFQDTREVRREQGTRAGGAAVGPLLRVYFPVQGVCGLLALVTALGWSKKYPASRAHRVRLWLLLVAVFLVLLSWPLERKVAYLGVERDQKIDEVLLANRPTAEMLEDATAAKQNFTTWHLVSLGLSLAGVVLVTGGMGLAAAMPAPISPAARTATDV
jgi:acyl-phosphate glycerol 3-phosphate acyltransferase